MSFQLISPFFPADVRPLLTDQTVSDLMIQDGKVFVDRGGKVIRFPTEPISNERLSAGIESIARILGQDINEQNPILDTRLPDGSRVAAVYAPCSPTGPTLTIRKFNRWYSTDELIEMGSLAERIRDRVVSEILDRRNILISGGTSSGKTTLVNAFIQHIPAQERLLAIEKPAELNIRHDNAVRWEAVDELPGRPAVTVSNLLVAALRHRPDRIILGEVRDHSAYDLLQAMNTGHSGTLSTIHADHALAALHRLSGLALSAHSNLSHEFVRAETAAAIHFVMHVQRGRDGKRRVTELVKVLGYSNSRQAFEVESIH